MDDSALESSSSGTDNPSSSDSDYSSKRHALHRTAKRHGINETPENMTVQFKVDGRNKAIGIFRKTVDGDYDCLCGLRFPGRSEVEKHLNPLKGMPPLDLSIHNKSLFNNRYKGKGKQGDEDRL